MDLPSFNLQTVLVPNRAVLRRAILSVVFRFSAGARDCSPKPGMTVMGQPLPSSNNIHLSVWEKAIIFISSFSTVTPKILTKFVQIHQQAVLVNKTHQLITCLAPPYSPSSFMQSISLDHPGSFGRLQMIR